MYSNIITMKIYYHPGIFKDSIIFKQLDNLHKYISFDVNTIFTFLSSNYHSNLIIYSASIIHLYGLLYYDSPFYLTITFINSILMFLMSFILFAINKFSEIDSINYSWINPIVGIPIIFVLYNNLNILLQNNSNIEIDTEVDNLEKYKQVQFIDNNNDNNDNDDNDDNYDDNKDKFSSNEHSNDSNESIEPNESNESNESNLENTLHNLDDCVQPIQSYYIDDQGTVELSKEYIEKYEINIELIDYIKKDCIYSYTTYLVNKSRLNQEEVQEINQIVGEKLTGREKRMLIRHINKLIVNKLT